MVIATGDEAGRGCSMATVLVADDDPDIRDLVVLKLELAGMEVLAAEDGTEALRKAREGHPDLIVLDLMMPGMSGLDVCRELRQDPAFAKVPIIMLTAKAQESDVEAGFEVGADDYVPKPFSPRELLARVKVLLGRGTG
jgi:DNA-binding response OmpR family regulator